jgi:DNA-binding MarR family transcriptional regulator
MVGALERLEAAGLVERHRDPQVRPGYRVRMTAKGRQMIRYRIPLRNQAADRNRAAVSAKERSVLRDMPRKVLGLTERCTDEEDRTYG